MEIIQPPKFRNYIVKWVTFFVNFCWHSGFQQENLKIKNNSDDVHWNVWTNIKTLHTKSNIFKKRNFGSNFVFGDCFRAFLLVFFMVGGCVKTSATMVGWRFYAASHHKKASYGPGLRQTNRANAQSYTVEEYFKKVISIPFLEH